MFVSFFQRRQFRIHPSQPPRNTCVKLAESEADYVYYGPFGTKDSVVAGGGAVTACGLELYECLLRRLLRHSPIVTGSPRVAAWLP